MHPFFLGQLPCCGVALHTCTFCSCAGCTLGNFKPAWQNCSVQILQLPSLFFVHEISSPSGQCTVCRGRHSSRADLKYGLEAAPQNRQAAPAAGVVLGTLLELVVTAPDS